LFEGLEKSNGKSLNETGSKTVLFPGEVHQKGTSLLFATHDIMTWGASSREEVGGNRREVTPAISPFTMS